MKNDHRNNSWYYQWQMVIFHNSCVSYQWRPQLVTNMFGLFLVEGWGMLTSLSTCSRHVCFVTLRVWVVGMWTSLSSRHVCFVTLRVWVGRDVNVIVNLLTPCMLRDSQGLGGGDVNIIVLTPCLLRDSQGLGGGDVNVIVLTPCLLRDSQGLRGRRVLTSLSTCSRHVCFVTLRVWVVGMWTSLSSRHVCFVTLRVWVEGMSTSL